MDGYNAYQTNTVLTQTPERLVVMLYEGAMRFLHRAEQAIAAGNHQDKAYCINKAMAIIDELNVSLDMEVGGEVATNLRQLYCFLTRHLNKAVTQNDPKIVREAIAILSDLHTGWKAIAS